ncbi:MAG: hypothetical protein M1451_07195 [Acidobacteria bacterium]|nr:hypothetical protein [Acidobacteriota bacterium]
MNSLARFFLRAKHWQIFLLLFGPMIFVLAITYHPDWKILSFTEAIGSSELTWKLLFFLCMCCNLAWMWATGEFLNSFASVAQRKRIGFFRFCLLLVLCYSILPEKDFGSNRWELNFSALLLAFVTYCSFYLVYFVSKSLVMAETSKPASFLDLAGPFLRVWFLPVGIWTIQPRINELYEKSLSPAETNRPESQ